MDDELSDEILAEALHSFFPVEDSDPIAEHEVPESEQADVDVLHVPDEVEDLLPEPDVNEPVFFFGED